MTENVDSRQHIEEFIDQGSWMKAKNALARIWSQQPTSATAGYIVSCCERLRDHLPLTTCHLAILRSFTVEPVVPLLRAAAFANGIDLTIQVGDFNTYVQEILDENSPLYRFKPDVVILAAQTRDIAPELWEDFADLSAAEIQVAVERIVDGFQNWVQSLRSRSQAHLIVHGFEVPPFPNQGIFDDQSGNSQVEAIQQINRELRRLASGYSGVHVLDYDALIGRHGRLGWYDQRKWLVMRMPIAAEHLVHLANEWLRFIHPLSGRTSKALVTDLDNTLWGGVIGEDGMEGIKVGSEYPGAAYRSLQRVMLDLYQRGTILAICSKNNLPDAMEVIEKHPGMLLRPQHFAVLRINWNDKVHNLREIADELNIGTDALAFLDDNPVERERVRTEMPEVNVIELPDDPMRYAQTLREIPAFERLVLSAEDRERGRYYVEQRQRGELERNAASLEDFYRSLDQEAEIGPVTQETLPRIAQLTQKTNQFNLTTRRNTEQQISEMANRREWGIYSLRVKDRFGDNGLVGVAILHFVDQACEIDSFLLSCRVIGRTVETAFLSFVVEEAQARGAQRLEGWFLPTKKNSPAKDFYPAHGFTLLEQEDKGCLWSLDLNAAQITCPQWIRIIANHREDMR